MNNITVAKVISLITVLIGLFMFSAVPVAWIMNDDGTVIGQLALTAVVPTVIGLVVFKFLRREKKNHVGFREGFAIVTLSWVFASLFGALPYMVIADLPFADAFFETMSGFTTTGASVLNNIEELPKGLLWWRAMTHWLGGMGIVVLSMAVLPLLGVGGMQMFKAEVPGPISDQMTPKIADSAKILWCVYVLLTGLESLALRIAGMPWFDSICHSFATMATGGFSTKQASIEYYHTAPGFSGGIYVDIIITIFMFLAGCNFILHLQALRGKPLNYFKDHEFTCYLKIVIFAIIGILLIGLPYEGFIDSLRNAAFTVVSIITTTGFCTGNFDIWPAFARLLLLSLMFIGGCGGSTGGGMKVSRIQLIWKYARVQISRCFYPHMVTNVKLNNAKVDGPTIHRTLSFFTIFMGIFIITALLITILEPTSDLETAISTSVACLGNIGPGLAKVGAWQNYSWFSDSSKLLLSFAMLAGRLELFTVIVLLSKRFWKK